MSQQSRTQHQHQQCEQAARELFKESPNMGIGDFCGRMQQQFPDLTDQDQLAQYYNRAKTDHELLNEVKKVQKLGQQIQEACETIIGQKFGQRHQERV